VGGTATVLQGRTTQRAQGRRRGRLQLLDQLPAVEPGVHHAWPRAHLFDGLVLIVGFFFAFLNIFVII
jgi:hypothetical protein